MFTNTLVGVSVPGVVLLLWVLCFGFAGNGCGAAEPDRPQLWPQIVRDTPTSGKSERLPQSSILGCGDVAECGSKRLSATGENVGRERQGVFPMCARGDLNPHDLAATGT